MRFSSGADWEMDAAFFGVGHQPPRLSEIICSNRILGILAILEENWFI